MSESLQFTGTLREWMDIFYARSMRDWSRYVKASGFSMPQFFILMQVHYRGQCGISHLSERMDISSAAASQLVEKLVQAGLLERTEDPNDRRAKQVALSEKGRNLIERGFHARYSWVEQLSASLSEPERQSTRAALEILTRAAKKLENKD